MQKLLILFLMTTGLFAHGNILKSQKVQLQCKEKAKEVAQSSYTYCLNEAREGELDKVKQDYKEKLDKLKNYYDKKIKALSGNDAESKKNIKQTANETTSTSEHTNTDLNPETEAETTN